MDERQFEEHLHHLQYLIKEVNNVKWEIICTNILIVTGLFMFY